MTYQTLFRVNADATQGLGHLMRCLALAQGMLEQDIESHFWINSDALELCKSRDDWVGQIYPLDSHVSELAELAMIAEFCQRQPIHTIVIDGYHFTQGYRKALKSFGLLVVCFDDTNSVGELWADIIVNGAGNAITLGYEHSNPTSSLCLGESYRVMRSEFCNMQKPDFEQRNELLISLGGSDPLGLTLPILRSIEQNEFNGKIVVITGGADQHFAKISEFITSCPLAIRHLHDCQSMAQEMQKARLAIAAAGGSQFELQACGCPSVLMVVADNQLNATLEAVSHDWCCSYDCRALNNADAKHRLVEQLVADVKVLWANQSKLLVWHFNALRTADVQGSKRLVNSIVKALADAK